MTDIALFHSVLGVRPGVLDAADRLEKLGHRVVVVDQYNGQNFDDYDEASAFAEGQGYAELMQSALTAVEGIPDGFVAAGFSNGGGMSQFVALHRRLSGVVMLSGTIGLTFFGEGTTWPRGLPAQIHYTVGDPFRTAGVTDEVAAEIRAAGGAVEVFDYPGDGHLFTDASLPAEYDAQATELLFSRVGEFCARVG